MCDQCLTNAVSVSTTALPKITLMRAQVGIESWPAGWYGLIDSNDPFLVFEGPLEVDTLAGLDDDALNNASIEQLAAAEIFAAAASRLGKALEALPAMTGYFLVKSCMDAGYNPETHGYSLESWLMNHLATTVNVSL